MASPSILLAYAQLLSYPLESRRDDLRSCLDQLRAERPKLGESLAGLASYGDQRSPTELEELFTRTFDSNAERALEVGWHIHGENYARGVFMARMRGLLREHGIQESSELPDHISHVLQVLARAKPELASALGAGVVLQALDKILEGFTSQENPYRGVIAGLRGVLEEEHCHA